MCLSRHTQVREPPHAPTRGRSPTWAWLDESGKGKVTVPACNSREGYRLEYLMVGLKMLNRRVEWAMTKFEEPKSRHAATRVYSSVPNARGSRHQARWYHF